jgi:hypothetical protein
MKYTAVLVRDDCLTLSLLFRCTGITRMKNVALYMLCPNLSMVLLDTQTSLLAWKHDGGTVRRSGTATLKCSCT